jgi:hypothetical protein
VRSSTSVPFAMSAGAVYSCGAWLIPSWLGTKIMAIGATWRGSSCAHRRIFNRHAVILGGRGRGRVSDRHADRA